MSQLQATLQPARWRPQIGGLQLKRPSGASSRRALRIAATAAGVIVALLYLALTIVPRTGLYATFVITSESMEPAIHRGAVVVVTALPPDQVRVGDVITFSSTLPPYPTLTHRVLSIERTDDGLAFQTKGDANVLIDPWQVSYAGQAGIVRLAIPLIGYAMVMTSSAAGQLILGLVLAGTLAFFWFRRVWLRPRVVPALDRIVAAHTPTRVEPSGGQVSAVRTGIIGWLLLALVRYLARALR